MRSLKLMLPVASSLLAAVAATLLFAVPAVLFPEEPWNIVVFSEIVTLARTIFLVALAHALLLGLPLFLFLRSRARDGIAGCVLGGFLVGAVPLGVLALISMIGTQYASTGGKSTVINGVPTAAGWIELAYTAGFAGLFGLAGGLTFWTALRLSGQIAGNPGASEIRSYRSSGPSWGIVSSAVLLTCVLFALPSIVKDTSCHNLFRDGRSSIRPQVYADLKLSAEDWMALRQIFVDFGSAHALSFRGDEKIRDGKIIWRSLSLCNEAGVNIEALDQPWLAKTQSRLADRSTNFRLFATRPDVDWKPLARDFVTTFDATWPQKATFRGADGRVVSAEEALNGR